LTQIGISNEAGDTGSKRQRTFDSTETKEEKIIVKTFKTNNYKKKRGRGGGKSSFRS
jgi:hypothetical protein